MANTNFTPREYQVELLEKALKKNIIVCLGTGSGKTFIAVMLIKEMMEELKIPFHEGGKRTFFLAKTVPLVAQQATVIRDHTGLNVGHYNGSMNVDSWDVNVWKRELKQNEVMVMTTQILVNMLNMAFISLSQINLLIFDECHHAVGGDPIVQVMKNFARQPLEVPKVMGLTASVLNGKCKPNQILGKIKKLEITLQSAIETPTNTAMANLFSTKPKENIVCCKEGTIYDGLKNGLAKRIVEELQKLPRANGLAKDLEKIDVTTNEDEDDEEEEDEEDDDFDDEDDYRLIMGPTIKLTRLLKDLYHVLITLGPWCACLLANQIMVELSKVEDDATDEQAVYVTMVTDFIKYLIPLLEEYFKRCCPNESDAIMKCSSPKINRLLETIIEHQNRLAQLAAIQEAQNQATLDNAKDGKCGPIPFPQVAEFKAIIFVERRSTAWVLNKFLSHLRQIKGEFYFLTSEFVMGHGTDPSRLNYSQMKVRRQQEKILKFRNNECNVIVATRVVEEGMDIPTCNIVFRFDEPKDFRSYVQSKGRARSRDNSFFIMLTNETDADELRVNVGLFRHIEDALLEICRERLPPTEAEVESFYDYKIEPFYTRGKQGPVVTMYSAIQLVNRYCSLLPKDKFTRLTPKVKFEKITPSIPPPMIDYDDEDVSLWDDFDVLLQNTAVVEKLQYRCILWLPTNSLVRGAIKGEVMETVKLAKKSVAMIACKMLHQAGELTDDLLPSMKDNGQFLQQLIDIEEEIVPENQPQPGTTKRRQIYQKQIAGAFKSAPPLPDQPCFLYYFKMINSTSGEADSHPVYNLENTKSCFGILTTGLIPKLTPFPLYTKNGQLWVEVVELYDDFAPDEDQLKLITSFHHHLFTDVLKMAGLKSEFIGSNVVTFDPMNSDSSFYVMPLINECNDYMAGLFPDWDLMEKIVELKENPKLPSEEDRRNFVFDADEFTNAVVIPLHGCPMNYYIVKDIWNNLKPSSDFPEINYSSFVEYYAKKYQTKIWNENDQPLLVVSLVTSSTNLLCKKVPTTRQRREMTIGDDVLPYKTLFVPELCHIHPMNAGLLSQAQCLPSIIYRLNDLLLARELLRTVDTDTRSFNLRELAPHARWSEVEKECRDTSVGHEPDWENDFNVEMFGTHLPIDEKNPSPHIILNALTTRAANDCFDLERLEILGDSFLKYSTTLYLFSQYPEADEGKLTCGRGKLVSNALLYQLAKKSGVANLVKVEIFSPVSHWIPPGFAVNKSAERNLTMAGIPFHLWKYLNGEDITGTIGVATLWSMIIRKMNQERTEGSDRISMQKDENVFNNATHQRIADKSVADGMEAIIGAYLLYSGPEAALRFILWLGLKLFPRCSDDEQAANQTQIPSFTPLNLVKTAYFNKKKIAPKKLLAGLGEFEEKIGYVFRNKSFLVQAFSHPSYYRNTVTDCYQRLEFLGDAILDYLITWHLFKDVRRFSPGKLSDLRSALVNNITFATMAVNNKFHHHLKAMSPSLFQAITKFLALVEKDKRSAHNLLYFTEEEALEEEEVEVPKALGDIFESVAGAIYLDSGYNLDVVWDVYWKIMQPTIDKYSENTPLSPIREFHEMFPEIKFSKALPIEKEKFNKDEDENNTKYFVKVIIGQKTFKGIGKNSKIAKLNAAKCVLRFMKRRPNRQQLFPVPMDEDPVPMDEDPVPMNEDANMAVGFSQKRKNAADGDPNSKKFSPGT